MYAIFQGIAAERDSRPSSPLPPLSMDSVSYILNTTERRILYDYVVEVYITMLCIAYCIQFPLYLYLYAYVYTHIRHLLISEHLCVCVCVCVCRLEVQYQAVIQKIPVYSEMMLQSSEVY